MAKVILRREGYFSPLVFQSRVRQVASKPTLGAIHNQQVNGAELCTAGLRTPMGRGWAAGGGRLQPLWAHSPRAFPSCCSRARSPTSLVKPRVRKEGVVIANYTPWEDFHDLTYPADKAAIPPR